jgi:glycosyltransferase involved in cell wall biosynthesis
VCIVTAGQIGSNPRVVKEAQALYEAGFQVTVIATRSLDRVEPRDQSLMRRIPWRLERVDLRSRWRWRLNRMFQVARRRAHAVTGLAHFADLGFSAATRPLLAGTLRTSADLYIAHYPAALPAAAAAARCHRGRYAYDAEDFHPGDWPDRADYDTERRLVRAIEERYLRGCAHVTAASPGIADAYVEAYGIARPEVVRNVFPLTHAPSGPTVKGTAEPGPSLYWFSQTIGPDRGLECAARAIGLARARPHLYLRGTAVAGFVDRLEEIAAGCGAAGRLHILPPDEPDKMVRLAASYDIGLVGENGKTRSRAIALTNKLFTFLLAGIPAVMSDIGAHRAFAAEAGMTEHLYPTDDAEALAAMIDRLLGDPARLAAARAKAHRLGRDQYNWDRECGALLKTVRQALERGSDKEVRSFARS